MNRYPAGNQIKVPFYFATRPLTQAEQERFFEGAGLPSGVGYKPAATKLKYTAPEASPTLLEAVEDAPGAYHAIIPTEEGWEGTVTYQGRALNGEGKLIAASTPGTFSIGA